MSTTFAVLMLCAPLAQEPAPAAPTAQAPSPVEAPAVAAINGFGLDLYKVLAAREPRENLFFSPLSVTMALTMVAEGARDETRAEMVKVLHLPETLLPAHEAFAALGKRLMAGNGASDVESRGKAVARLQDLVRRQRDPMDEGGATKDQVGPRLQDEMLAEAVNEAIDASRALSGPFDLRCASALWVDRGSSLVPTFVTAIERCHGSGRVNVLDLLDDPEGARSRIDIWARRQTDMMIRDMPPGPSGEPAGLVITCAAGFRAAWERRFERWETSPQEFTLADGEVVQARSMRRTGDGMRYAAFDGQGDTFLTPGAYPDASGFTMAEVPYDGGLVMTLIVPRSPGGLARVEQMLDAPTVDAWCQHLLRRPLDLGIPRFRLEVAEVLEEPLRRLGMRRAFCRPPGEAGAQFRGVVEPPADTWIGSIRSKAVVSADEDGTGAVARSPGTVIGGRRARMFGGRFLPVFRADRPFLFLIRDTVSGAILFVGRVVDPR